MRFWCGRCLCSLSAFPAAVDAAVAPLARVIDFYLRESFGGEALGVGEREELKTALEEAERGLRRAG